MARSLGRLIAVEPPCCRSAAVRLGARIAVCCLRCRVVVAAGPPPPTDPTASSSLSLEDRRCRCRYRRRRQSSPPSSARLGPLAAVLVCCRPRARPRPLDADCLRRRLPTRKRARRAVCQTRAHASLILILLSRRLAASLPCCLVGARTLRPASCVLRPASCPAPLPGPSSPYKSAVPYVHDPSPVRPDCVCHARLAVVALAPYQRPAWRPLVPEELHARPALVALSWHRRRST